MAQKTKVWGGARSRAGRKIKLEPASPPDESPLDYLHRIMRDGATNPARRDWAAKTALPYAGTQRAKAGKIGKKEEVNEEAKTAGHGTGWAGDLDFDAGRPN